MDCLLVTQESAFAALRGAWNRLAGDDPLASWEWRAAWWQTYRGRRRLAVAVVRDEDRIVGIAPCYSDRGPIQGLRLSWLGSGKACTDYQRLLIDSTLTDVRRTSVCEALVDTLCRHGRRQFQQDLWDLDGLAADSADAAMLAESLRRRGFFLHAEPVESSWVTELPADWPTFVAGTRRAIRRKINKAQRRAAAGDVHYFNAVTPHDIESRWPEFVRLHSARFGEKVRDGGCFADPQFAVFLPEAVRRLAERGLVRLVGCAVERRNIAMQLYLLGGRTASMYQSGFDPAFAHLEPGHLLYTQVVQDLIAAGYERLDFLRGDEPYKADWNARPLRLARWFCVPPRPLARLRHQTYCWARSLGRTARQAWSSAAADAADDVAQEAESSGNE